MWRLEVGFSHYKSCKFTWVHNFEHFTTDNNIDYLQDTCTFCYCGWLYEDKMILFSQGVGGECEKEYSTLLHSCESPKPSVAPQADDVGHYSQLNTVRVKGVFNKL